MRTRMPAEFPQRDHQQAKQQNNQQDAGPQKQGSKQRAFSRQRN